MMRAILALSAIVIGAAAAATSSSAQEFPSQPIRLILGFPPGGQTDLTGRVISRGFAKALNSSVVPENRPGAAGSTAAAYVARTPPDGYTLILIDPGTVINTMIRANAGYKIDEFTPVGMVATSPVLIVASVDAPYKDLKAMIDFGKANQGKLTYGSPGIGATGHLTAELMLKETGVKAVHVPYTSSSLIMPDIMSGKVPVAFSTIASSAPFVFGGKVNAIATTGAKRASMMPAVPTVTEAGFPRLTVDIWQGIVGSKGTPDSIVAKLNAGLVKALADPEVVEGLKKIGLEPWSSTPKEMANLLAGDEKRWPPVIEAAGIVKK